MLRNKRIVFKNSTETRKRNKKVLLRETTRGIPLTMQQVLALLFCLGGGGRRVPQSHLGWRVPQSYPAWRASPVLARGGNPSPVLAHVVPQSRSGPGGMPVLFCPRSTPVLSCLGVWLSWGTPLPGTGVPSLARTGVPLHPTRTGVSPLERTWYQRPWKEPGTGVPSPSCGQTENITLPILRMPAVRMSISIVSRLWKCLTKSHILFSVNFKISLMILCTRKKVS